MVSTSSIVDADFRNPFTGVGLYRLHVRSWCTQYEYELCQIVFIYLSILYTFAAKKKQKPKNHTFHADQAW